MISIERGRKMRYSMRSTTDEHWRLDIRDLERKGLLKPIGWTTLTWKQTGTGGLLAPAKKTIPSLPT